MMSSDPPPPLEGDNDGARVELTWRGRRRADASGEMAVYLDEEDCPDTDPAPPGAAS